jgi:two-component system sensor histidine kinase/response regulator
MSILATPDQPGVILIVDDMPANLRLLSQILAGHKYKVRAVLNGAHAISAAQAAPPDLILLDIRMPEMDGYQVCQMLQADERTRDIPILFISALSETEDKIRAFNAGGVDYITKPFHAAEVLARVQTHLTLRSLYRQLQAANAELARHVAELEARNQDLDAFAHTVAHDLKNPVAQLIGYAEILRDDFDLLSLEDRARSLSALLRVGDKIDNILDELLLLAQVRKVDVELRPLDMGSIVAEARQRLANVIEGHHAELVLPDTCPPALGHAPWVEEVWVNYLSNGCKYGGTPSTAPRLELGARVLPEGPVRFWVRDSGNGIAPEDLTRLFTPFTRLDQVHAKGQGLGLSIVRRIVEKLGGEVGVSSEGIPGHGSTFSFTLPGVPS